MATTWRQATWGKVLLALLVGAIAAMVIGFHWGDWSTSSTAEKMASDRVEAAVVKVTIPICTKSFLAQPGAAKKLEELRAIDSTWQKHEFMEKGGWATIPGSENPVPGLANACADELTKAKK